MNVSDVNNGSGRLVRYRRYVSPPLIALVLAILLFFSGGLINPDFVNLNQATNIVRLAAFLGIIAAGQTLPCSARHAPQWFAKNGLFLRVSTSAAQPGGPCAPIASCVPR